MFKSCCRLALNVAFASLALGTLTLNGDEAERNLPFNQGNLLLSGELLYLKPGLDQSGYAIKSDLNAVGDEVFPNGKRYSNNMQYKPGFRVEALYQLCEAQSALDARFTYFDTGYSSSVHGNYMFDTVGSPGDGAQIPEDTTYDGKAKVRDHFKYYSVDATFNRQILKGCSDILNLLIGLESSNIQYTRHFKSLGTFGTAAAPVQNTLHSRSRFWGIGPVVGLGYLYHLTADDCCWGVFGVKGNVRGALLCGRSHANFHFHSTRTVGTEGVNLKNRPTWKVIPTLDAKLGATYQRCFCGYNTFIELGYEWIWIHNGINNITGYDVAFAGDSMDVYNDFGLHGPYLKVNFVF